VDRAGFRAVLKESLDEIYSVRHDAKHIKDSLESKLFGIGSESYVVGSHDFYMGYAPLQNLMLCLDMGHFHPTESVADKISAILQFHQELLIHVSRGVRWDSDHVVILDAPVQDLAHEIVRGRSLGRVHLALDFMDGSINRVAAWVTGARAVLKAMLIALLEPTQDLVALESEGNYTKRLILLEELKGMPFGAVWDAHCLREGVPVRQAWIPEIEEYEARVLSKRSKK
jgi:L-rhamnose isomerase